MCSLPDDLWLWPPELYHLGHPVPRYLYEHLPLRPGFWATRPLLILEDSVFEGLPRVQNLQHMNLTVPGTCLSLLSRVSKVGNQAMAAPTANLLYERPEESDRLETGVESDSKQSEIGCTPKDRTR